MTISSVYCDAAVGKLLEKKTVFKCQFEDV